MSQQRTIHVWAEDKPGVLMRIANIITAKGANIDRLTANADAMRAGVSKVTVVATLEPRLHSRVVCEMNRLVNVLIALDVTDEHRARTVGGSVRKELLAC